MINKRDYRTLKVRFHKCGTITEIKLAEHVVDKWKNDFIARKGLFKTLAILDWGDVPKRPKLDSIWEMVCKIER